MNTKVIILFSFTALLMFSQYALPNSFADKAHISSSIPDLNTKSSSIPSVTDQSSSDISSDSSTTQPVTTQPVTTQPVTTQPVTTQPASVPWLRGTIPQYPSQTTTSDMMSNSNNTSSQSHTHVHVPRASPSSLKIISGQWANNKMSDSVFIQNIQHFINLGNYVPGTIIPQWIKNNAMLLYKGQIDEKTFEAGIHDWLSNYQSSTNETVPSYYTPQYISSSTPQSTNTVVTPNSATLYYGNSVTFTATVTDSSASPNALTGTISWSDGSIGGVFSSTTCTLYSDSCTVSYTPSVNSPSAVVITANYEGDTTHQSSSGTASLTYAASSVTLASYTTSNIQTDKTSYDPGNTVTISVNPEGAQVGQNVAILVTNPSSNIVVSRTVQVDDQGNSELKIGLSPDAQAGTYQITASALVNGNHLSYNAEFTVTSNISQSLGVSIVSVQPTDQQGNKTVTSFSKGTTSYAKVILSSNSTQTVLVTVNLVDSNGTSLGVGSVKTSLGSGNSQMEISFYIPDDTSVGTGNIYANVYTDWPNNGGVPLTRETSSKVSIE